MAVIFIRERASQTRVAFTTFHRLPLHCRNALVRLVHTTGARALNLWLQFHEIGSAGGFNLVLALALGDVCKQCWQREILAVSHHQCGLAVLSFSRAEGARKSNHVAWVILELEYAGSGHSLSATPPQPSGSISVVPHVPRGVARHRRSPAAAIPGNLFRRSAVTFFVNHRGLPKPKAQSSGTRFSSLSFSDQRAHLMKLLLLLLVVGSVLLMSYFSEPVRREQGDEVTSPS